MQAGARPAHDSALEGSPLLECRGVTREPLLCCRSAGFGASGLSTCPADTAESHRVVGRRAEESPADMHQPSEGVQVSRRLKPSLLVQCNSQGPPGWRRLGNYLSASSVPHNWLSFANSQLGWEGAKSLEGASSRHKTLPKISGPFPPLWR